MQYVFNNKEHAIELKPHGNSIGKTPYRRTKPSTLCKIKEGVTTKAPRQVLHEIENSMGGVINAQAGCDLPCNRQQAYNARKAVTKDVPGKDTLAEMMRICKEAANSKEVYVRAVEAAPEPTCILASEQQLVDLDRFCTREKFSVMSVDPTLNLGQFYVNPITFQNLLVSSNFSRNSKHPILIGPVLIHHTKTFHAFYYFASTLTRLKPNLKNILSFGTDGESELIKALHCAFPKAVHLRCTNHFRQNVKEKLRKIGVSQNVAHEITADIFGVQFGTHMQLGLIDSEDMSHFHSTLLSLREKWNNLERSCVPAANEPMFHSWFTENHAPIIKGSILPEIRKQAEVTAHFTTNNSESMNSIIKKEVEWKENSLPALTKHLKTISDRQNTQYQKAVISRGEWKFISSYKLEVGEDDWFHKTQQQKEDHIRKVMTVKPVLECNKSIASSCDSNNSFTSGLEVDFENVMITSVARDTLKSIWKKANDLVLSKTDIVIPTWSDNPKARLVKSNTSSNVPHFVIPHKKFLHQYCCDEKCQMYQGFQICSHTVATAHINGELQLFLDWYVENNCQLNLLAIGTQGMPKGVGRKGRIPKRKRNHQVPVETSSSRFKHDITCEPSSSSQFGHHTIVEHTSELPPKYVILPSSSQTTPSITSCTTSVPSSLQTIASKPTLASQVTRNSVPTLNNAPQENLSNLNLLTNLITAVCQSPTTQHPTSQPFTLKFRSNAINICQSCRQGFTEADMLVIASLERRMVQNLSTGVNILGRESNSHYHATLVCLRKADSTFTGSNLVIPTDVKQNLTIYHKQYLCEQLLVPITEFQ